MAIGNPFKGLSKNQRIAAGVGGAAVAGLIVWRHFHPAAASSSGTAATTGTDAGTDPTLGYTSTGNAGGYSYGTPITGGGAAAATPPGQTPSDWITAAETGIVNDLGYDPATVQAAFATWVSGGYLTAAQAAIIHAAVTEFPGGPAYPIKLAPAGGGGTTPHPPAGGGTTSPPGGTKQVKPATPGGVRAGSIGRAGFTLTWPAVKGATSYRVKLTYQGDVVYDRTTGSPQASISGLTPNHTYTAHVAAANAAGTSAETNGPAVKTAR